MPNSCCCDGQIMSLQHQTVDDTAWLKGSLICLQQHQHCCDPDLMPGTQVSSAEYLQLRQQLENLVPGNNQTGDAKPTTHLLGQP